MPTGPNPILDSSNNHVAGVTYGGAGGPSVQALSGLPIGKSASGELYLKTGTASGAGTSSTGATNLSTGQVSTNPATPTTAVIARPTRVSVVIRNLDTAITVYVGPATVTAANGFPIKPGESMGFTTVGLIQAIAASGAPYIAYADEYN